MSSSISSSDPLANPAPWRRHVAIAAATAAGAVALVLSLAVLVDPYDTGRFGIWDMQGVRPQGPRTANASRARDPRFTSAILGNSHVQLLSPERLSAATGQSFVSLIVPGSRVREPLAILEWFVSRPRPRLASVVIGADTGWCAPDRSLPLEHPFPFWLYAPSPFAYLAGLMRFDTLEETPNRVRYLLSNRARRASPDGYWDYEPNYVALGFGTDPRFRQRLETRQVTYPANPEGVFPAAARLGEALRALPAEVHVALLFPPMHRSGLPEAGSAAERMDLACKAALAGAARAARSGTQVIDWRTDGPHADDPDLWFDATHYRHALARRIEDSIAAALAARRGPSPPA